MEDKSFERANVFRVITLKRVSSDEQSEGAGLDAQDRITSEILDDIEQETKIVEEIKEEGISGTKIPRESLIKILNLARRNEFDALAVKDVSRIGRLAGPTFGFIWVLNNVFNVDILTEDGQFNVRHKTDLIQMFFDSLNAEMKNRFRTSYVVEAQLASFRDGNFHVTGRKPRFGYQKESVGESKSESEEEESEDERIKEGEDIEVVQSEAEVVERMFECVVEIGRVRNLFARVREKLSHEFDEHRLPGDDVDLKDLLRNPIYKGEPTWEIDVATDNKKQAIMNRDDLSIVDDDLFEEVGEFLDDREAIFWNNNETNDQTATDRVTLQQITSMVGLSRLVAFDDVVRIHCPSCGEEMYDNGKWRATSDIRPTNVTEIPEEPILKRYRCPNEDCERSEKRFPNEFEGYMLLDNNIPLDNLVEQV